MKKLCPLPAEGGKREPCSGHACEFYVQVLGKHPQQDAPIEQWGCAFKFTPYLVLELAQQVRQSAAATESARNEARVDASAMAASVVRMAEEVGAMARAARPVPAVLDAVPVEIQQRIADAQPGFFRRLLGR